MTMKSMFRQFFTFDFGSVFSRNAHIFFRRLLTRLYEKCVRVFPQFLGASFQETRTCFPAVLGVSCQETLTYFAAVFGRVFSRNVDVFFRHFRVRIFKKRERLLPQFLDAFFQDTRMCFSAVFGSIISRNVDVFSCSFGCVFSRNSDVFCRGFWARPFKKRAYRFYSKFRGTSLQDTSSCYKAISWMRPLKTRA